MPFNTLFEDFALFKEDLFNTSDTNRGAAFRGLLLLALMAGTVAAGSALLHEMRTPVVTVPQQGASQKYADDSITRMADEELDIYDLRHRSELLAGLMRSDGRYVFDGLPAPETLVVRLPEERKLPQEEAELLDLYGSVDPMRFMQVSAIMHGPRTPVAIVEMTDGAEARTHKVVVGDRIPYASRRTEIEITAVTSDTVKIRIDNGEWELPVVSIEERRAALAKAREKDEAQRSEDSRLAQVRAEAKDPAASEAERIEARNEEVSILRSRLYRISGGKFGAPARR